MVSSEVPHCSQDPQQIAGLIKNLSNGKTKTQKDFRAKKSNFKVKELPTEVFEKLNAQERHKRMNVLAKWGYDIFEELGQEAVDKIAEAAIPDNLARFNF